MPPRLALRPIGASRRAVTSTLPRAGGPICLFCSLSRPLPTARKPQRRPSQPRRASTISPPPVPERTPDPRRCLEDALLDLQKHAANYVNLSRLQLALRGLRQEPGNESIRVAVLGLTNDAGSGERTARELLRLLLADPLKAEAEWEGELKAHDAARPLVIRVGERKDEGDGEAQVAVAKESLLREMHVSSPSLGGNNLEVLLMEANSFPPGPPQSFAAVEDAVLVPTIDIPTSNSGRYTPVTTPVHKAVIVGDGIIGAASIVNMLFLKHGETILTAVNLARSAREDNSSYPFVKVNVEAGAESLRLIREDIGNAMKYEALWHDGNVSAVTEWLKSGVLSNVNGNTKRPVRDLIASLLQSTVAAIHAEEGRRLSSALSARISSSAVTSLNEGLAAWAESAHAELQQQLDIAFTGRRWRKLGWWKLFWRVDDVGMLSSEMLNQRFLPEAERGIIYLAGRIEEAGVTTGEPDRPTYSGPLLAPPAAESGVEVVAPTLELEGKWPTHIPYTRAYLLDKTVPALQALAQKLVVQTLSTSALTSSLAGLLYLSSFGAYEAGSVAALGIVWSLSRMQRKWETARDYWEGEVREEGRKAVRAVEDSVARVLDRSKEASAEGGGLDDLQRARELVDKAEDALADLK